MTRRLSAPVQIDHGLRLGMSEAQVTAVLGAPDAEEAEASRRTLVYRAEVDSDQRITLSYEAKYRV